MDNANYSNNCNYLYCSLSTHLSKFESWNGFGGSFSHEDADVTIWSHTSYISRIIHFHHEKHSAQIGALHPITKRIWAGIVALPQFKPLESLEITPPLTLYPNTWSISVNLCPSVCLLESKWGDKQSGFFPRGPGASATLEPFVHH